MKRWKKYEDFFLKLLALSFAVLLWFFVALQEKVTREISARIVYRNLPPGTLLLESDPSFVRVRVVGPRSLLRSLPDRPLILSLSLAHLSPGFHQVKIPPDRIRLPSGLKVQEIHPPRVEVLLDRVVEKWVKVLPRWRGRPAEGYSIVGFRVRPVSVRVKGARRIVGHLKTLYTLPVDVTGKKSSFETEVFVKVPEGVIDIKPNRVWVKVLLGRAKK